MFRREPRKLALPGGYRIVTDTEVIDPVYITEQECYVLLLKKPPVTRGWGPWAKTVAVNERVATSQWWPAEVGPRRNYYNDLVRTAWAHKEGSYS